MMGRVGFWHEEAGRGIRQIAALPQLRVEALYTHFPSADENLDDTSDWLQGGYEAQCAGALEMIQAGALSLADVEAAKAADPYAFAFDYIIADSHIVPARLRGAYGEKVVYLPDTFQANDSKRPTTGPPPEKLRRRLSGDDRRGGAVTARRALRHRSARRTPRPPSRRWSRPRALQPERG